MKEMSIYVDGKYDYSFRILNCVYYMSYKTAVVKKTERIMQDGSPARAQLQSLYLALQQVKEPCVINIYSKYPLGFKNPKKCNSKDLISDIINTVIRAGHEIKFNVDKEFYQVQIWEQTYGTKLPKNNIEKEKERHEVERDSKPDIDGKQTPNEIFSIREESVLSKEEMLQKELDELYNDISVWVPGSGGY